MEESCEHRASQGLVVPPGLTADVRGYVHPRSEEEVCRIVRYARDRRIQVRVRGSAHSVPGAIHADARLGVRGRPAVEMVLDRLTAVAFDEARGRVTAQAGCRFGRDPRDPTKRSTVEGGLCFQLDERGLALPNLGGVSHATVAGFLATGSAGGSVRHSLHDSVVAIRLLDGTGAVRELSREADPDLFFAAGVSMGLCGVVLAVTFQCVPRFDVIGSESVVRVERCPFDLRGEGPGGLAAFLEVAPYARILWWPQKGVDKLAIWQARPLRQEEHDDDTGPPWALRPRPYRAFDPVLGTTLPVQAAAGAALAVLGGWRGALGHVAGPALGDALGGALRRAGLGRVEAAAIDAFVPEDVQGPRRFWDAWWRALPMDDGIDERLLPTTFTEVSLPLAAAAEAMRRLADLFARDPEAAGSFAIEIYAAGSSPFWMSPHHGRASLRINVFWFVRNPEDPRERHFPKLWSLLEGLGARLHWGKILPLDAGRSAAHLARSYPRWDDFLRARQRLDPEGIFLTAYWRAHLGIEGAGGASSRAPLPEARAFDEPAGGGRRWPLLFPMRAADASFLSRAERTIEVRGYVPAPVEEVYRAFWLAPEKWIVGFVGVEWLTEADVPEDSVTDVTLAFMTIRMRCLALEPPRRWRTAVLSCSLPLGTSVVEAVDLEPAADGGTDVRWRVAYDVHPLAAPFLPVLERAFSLWFSRSLASLARHLGARR